MSVTCCVLTHNSGKLIYNHLSNIYSLFDEIIIIDDDSTDNTIKEINRFLDGHIGDTKIKFDKRSLNFDFSAQRNYASSLATCDWIMHLDSDEILSPMLAFYLRHLIENCDKERKSLVFIPRINLDNNLIMPIGPDYQGRLFRKFLANGSVVQYSNKIHEMIYLEKNDCVALDPLSGMDIIHYCSSEDRLAHHNFYQDKRFYE